jgi:rRNA maturation protein Nop10
VVSDTLSGNKTSVPSLLKYCALAGAAYVAAAVLADTFNPVPWLDDIIFDVGVWLSSRVSPLPWRAPRPRLDWPHLLVSDGVVDQWFFPLATVAVLAVLHTLAFVASAGAYWQFGRPRYLPDVVRRTGCKLVIRSWMLSAWSCAVFFPLARGAWRASCRMYELQQPVAKWPPFVSISLTFLCLNVAFFLLVLAYVSAHVLRTRIRRSVPSDLRRCDRCGYLLFGLENPRCPECGTQNNRARPPRFSLLWRPSGWRRRAAIVSYLALCVGLLTAPVLVPWLYGHAAPVLVRVWPSLPRPAEPCALSGFAVSGEELLTLQCQGALNRLHLVPDEYGWWLYEVFASEDTTQTVDDQPVRAGRGVLSSLERRAITLGSCTVYCTPISDNKIWIEPLKDALIQVQSGW